MLLNGATGDPELHEPGNKMAAVVFRRCQGASSSPPRPVFPLTGRQRSVSRRLLGHGQRWRAQVEPVSPERERAARPAKNYDSRHPLQQGGRRGVACAARISPPPPRVTQMSSRVGGTTSRPRLRPPPDWVGRGGRGGGVARARWGGAAAGRAMFWGRSGWRAARGAAGRSLC